jgi:alpha-glucosidase
MEVPNKTFPMDDMIMMVIRSHRKAHNIYGTQMARATYHGVKNLLTQSAFIIYQISIPGAQRYTSWTGDNVASWEHLWIANIQVQRVSFLVWVQILVVLWNNLQENYTQDGCN